MVVSSALQLSSKAMQSETLIQVINILFSARQLSWLTRFYVHLKKGNLWIACCFVMFIHPTVPKLQNWFWSNSVLIHTKFLFNIFWFWLILRVILLMNIIELLCTPFQPFDRFWWNLILAIHDFSYTTISICEFHSFLFVLTPTLTEGSKYIFGCIKLTWDEELQESMKYIHMLGLAHNFHMTHWLRRK